MTTPTIQSLDAIAESAMAKRDKLLSQMIRAGQPVTRLYRIWCENRRFELGRGIYEPGHPRVLPYRDPVRCLACGEVMERTRADASRERVCRETFEHPAGDILICPECGEREANYDPVPTCDECDCYPCCCK